MKYTVSKHAAQRIQYRLGIPAHEIERWANEAMKKAKYIRTERRGKQSLLHYDYEGSEIVANVDEKVIVTVHPAIDLRDVRPVFEREFRKIKREVTRKSRQLELAQATDMQTLAEKAINKAKARNPKIRQRIEAKMNEIQRRIDGYSVQMQREEDRLNNFERAMKVLL